MPTFYPGARDADASYLALPAAPAIRQISRARALIHQWYDVALTEGAHVDVSGGAGRWMEMWEQKSPRIDLVSTGITAPALVAGGNDAKALSFERNASNNLRMGSLPDKNSLAMPNSAAWSILVAVRPISTIRNFLLGYVRDATPANSMWIEFMTGGGLNQYPRMMNSTPSASVRIADTVGPEYNNLDSVIVIGFDTATGLTMTRNGVVVATNTHAVTGKAPLNQLPFQIASFGPGVSASNYNGFIYALMMYRANILAEPYTNIHRTVVKAYCDRIGIAHPFG